MNTLERLDPGLVGAVACGAGVALVGFAGARWTAAASAERTGQQMAGRQVAVTSVAVCVERADADAERAARLASVRQATTATRQRDAMMATGYVAVERNAAASGALPTACLAVLEPRRSALALPVHRTGR